MWLDLDQGDKHGMAPLPQQTELLTRGRPTGKRRAWLAADQVVRP